jgi:hypothetical protein
MIRKAKRKFEGKKNWQQALTGKKGSFSPTSSKRSRTEQQLAC